MDDLISRQAAIDALRKMQTYKLFSGDDMLLIDQAGAQTELMLLPPAQLGANLAEVGTDAVSREAVKELAYSQISSMYCGVALKEQRETMLRIADNVIGLLAPVASKQSEIIRCKDCKYAEYIDDVQSLWCTECGNGRTVAPYDFCSYGEVRAV